MVWLVGADLAHDLLPRARRRPRGVAAGRAVPGWWRPPVAGPGGSALRRAARVAPAAGRVVWPNPTHPAPRLPDLDPPRSPLVWAGWGCGRWGRRLDPAVAPVTATTTAPVPPAPSGPTSPPPRRAPVGWAVAGVAALARPSCSLARPGPWPSCCERGSGGAPAGRPAPWVGAIPGRPRDAAGGRRWCRRESSSPSAAPASGGVLPAGGARRRRGVAGRPQPSVARRPDPTPTPPTTTSTCRTSRRSTLPWPRDFLTGYPRPGGRLQRPRPQPPARLPLLLLHGPTGWASQGGLGRRPVHPVGGGGGARRSWPTREVAGGVGGRRFSRSVPGALWVRHQRSRHALPGSRGPGVAAVVHGLQAAEGDRPTRSRTRRRARCSANSPRSSTRAAAALAGALPVSSSRDQVRLPASPTRRRRAVQRPWLVGFDRVRASGSASECRQSAHPPYWFSLVLRTHRRLSPSPSGWPPSSVTRRLRDRRLWRVVGWRRWRQSLCGAGRPGGGARSGHLAAFTVAAGRRRRHSCARWARVAAMVARAPRSSWHRGQRRSSAPAGSTRVLASPAPAHQAGRRQIASGRRRRPPCAASVGVRRRQACSALRTRRRPRPAGLMRRAGRAWRAGGSHRVGLASIAGMPEGRSAISSVRAPPRHLTGEHLVAPRAPRPGGPGQRLAASGRLP